MPGWTDAALIGLAVFLTLPAWVLVLELMLAGWPRRLPIEAGGETPATVVLIPAHDEAAGIGATVERLRDQCGPTTSLLVIADNCTDDTAGLATAAGAEVIVRNNPAERGKGFALDFGMRHLAQRVPAAMPEVVIVFDADCTISPGGLGHLSRVAARTGRPVQATYMIDPPVGAGPGPRVSAFAVRVKNVCRPQGLAVLGVAPPLAGTGMAFPWTVLRACRLGTADIVEDMKLGVDLVRAGKPPLSCPDVTVRSALPQGAAANLEQRRRWEHGHLGIIGAEALPLLWHGLATRNWRTLLFALDLLIPPLALLLLLLIGALALSSLFWLLGATPAAAKIILAALAAMTGMLLVTWWRVGRDILPPRELLAVPGYVLGKIGLYTGFVRHRQTKWVRTDRN